TATGDVDGQLGDLHVLQALVLLRAELHARVQDVVEVAGELLQLGLRVGLDPGVGHGLLGLNEDLHGCLQCEIWWFEYRRGRRERAGASSRAAGAAFSVGRAPDSAESGHRARRNLARGPRRGRTEAQPPVTFLC